MTRWGNERKPDSTHDNYETPAFAVRALVRREALYGKVLEPCCGPGSICRELIAIDPDIDLYACDLRNTHKIFGVGGVDFSDMYALARDCDPEELRGCVDYVVTNPPFRESTAITRNCLHVARRGVYIFQRINWLEGLTRYRKQWSQWPLRHIWIFVSRVQCFREGEAQRGGGGQITFAWYCFDHGHAGRPTIGWIDDPVSYERDERIGI